MTFAIDGTIGKDYWGDDDTIISAKKVRDWLSEQKGDITIEINSGGGSVMEGISIYNLLRDYSKGSVEVVIVGMCASIASYLIYGADTIKAHDNAVFMIHNVSSWASGDHNDLRETANVIEGLTKLLAKTYVKKTGKSEKTILALMNKESWFYGNEIIKNSFVDESVETSEDSTKSEMVAIAKETFGSTIKFVKEKEKENSETPEAIAYLANLKPKTQPRVNALNAKLKLRLKEIETNG